ncbi:hypothetical protein [Cupriavidus agavae]|uniref:Type VI secretion protein n=1 Tax=Cupriavidus agavae TaxID=1001822 RepID=A0A4Q7RRU7_9BURK|nr:hypothetical protein [Cupriavidus agavae]RZT36425.1 hypothetical protein EV147_3745 [Cupriavidus agavae]
MAVDFSLLPAEEVFKGKRPSPWFWSMAFVVMVATGVAWICLAWPDDLPTDTLRFWATVTIFPVLIPAFIVLRRYAWYEGGRERVELHNEAVRQYNEWVFSAASIPLALLGAAYRVSAEPGENAATGIRHGALVLRTRVPRAVGAEPVRARWLEVAGMPTRTDHVDADRHRARHVTAWLFDELVGELSSRIAALPASLPLHVHLAVANGLAPEENRALWTQRSELLLSRSLMLADDAAPVDLFGLDGWLDRLLADKDQHARLVVAVQLQPLLKGSPAPGMAEAGAAVLLLPDGVARQRGIPRRASLHRPVRSRAEQAQESFSTALRWAPASSGKIAGVWHAGLDATPAGALRTAIVKAELDALPTDLDQTVGDAGVAAPWLALACAAATLAEAGHQVIAVGREEQIDCAVLAGTNAQ